MDTSPSTTVKICDCGATFPPDRAPQAKYHSDPCAAAQRKRAQRLRDSDLRNLTESADDDADRVEAARPVPAPSPSCDHHPTEMEAR